jgi:hypothetical protein
VSKTLDSHYINLMELLDVYAGLNNSMNTMRTAVRKEIDAANLAAKVQEQSIRLEQEALISRQQAVEQAKARELEILAEKRAAYEAEMIEAERVKAEMAKAKDEMQAELDQLAQARSAAQTPEEVAAVEEKAGEVITAQTLADEIQRDMQANLQTSYAAASNLNREIQTVQQQGPDEQALPVKKKMNLTPILLTAAAGLLLS